MTAHTIHAATESKGLFARLWDALPDHESVFFLATGLGMAGVIAAIF
ncbi:MAG TPA: hypothetical protein VEB20_20235 [Azospirillaceae bacterium]|nr:hypothetical protein [Azospirillaceae bacterium]